MCHKCIFSSLEGLPASVDNAINMCEYCKTDLTSIATARKRKARYGKAAMNPQSLLLWFGEGVLHGKGVGGHA